MFGSNFSGQKAKRKRYTMPANMDTFNEQVMEQIDKQSLVMLSTHPRDILDRTIYAVNRVFVSKPEDDTPETKVQMVQQLLQNLADAVSDPENPLDLEFVVDPDTHRYTGQVRFDITKELAAELVPDEMQERSRLNRVKKAAKRFMSR